MTDEQSPPRKVSARRRQISGRAMVDGCFTLLFAVPVAVVAAYISFAIGWGLADEKGLPQAASIACGVVSCVLGLAATWKLLSWNSSLHLNFERWRLSGEAEAWVRTRWQGWNNDEWLELWRGLRVLWLSRDATPVALLPATTTLR